MKKLKIQWKHFVCPDHLSCRCSFGWSDFIVGQTSSHTVTTVFFTETIAFLISKLSRLSPSKETETNPQWNCEIDTTVFPWTQIEWSGESNCEMDFQFRIPSLYTRLIHMRQSRWRRSCSWLPITLVDKKLMLDSSGLDCSITVIIRACFIFISSRLRL